MTGEPENLKKASEMHMPEFTAEVSLYRLEQQYRQIFNASVNSQAVLPQRARCYIFSAAVMCGTFGICDARYGGMVCYR